MARVLLSAKLVADSDRPIMVIGESGVGKELLVQAVHQLSPRRDKPFVTFNSPNLSAELAESILFGHRKGAFTSAHQDQRGLFQLADGGTLFLDEIGELPLVLQAKLLRVIEDHEIRPVGSLNTKTVDVRVIVATHHDLDQMVEAGTFRRDLYHRLRVFKVDVPPLRERPEDIDVLVPVALEIARQTFPPNTFVMPEETLTYLKRQVWLGNIRELIHAICGAALGALVERVTLETEPGQSTIPILSRHVKQVLGEPSPIELPGLIAVPFGNSFSEAKDAFIKSYLEEALARTHGNRSAAARLIHLDLQQFKKYARKFGLH